MWIETLGIPPKAKNRKAAIDYIRYIQRPEVQAKLTWRRAYRSNIPNVDGIAHVAFTAADIVRHPLVSRIVAAYDRKSAKATRNRR